MDGRTVLVLGGYGETGRRLARLLVERTDAHVVVAGRHARRAAALAAELGAQRVRGIGLDAADAPSVRRALEGVDLLVNAAVVPRHVAVLTRTAISAGTDWLDFQIHRGQARVLDGMADEIAAAGRCFVTHEVVDLRDAVRLGSPRPPAPPRPMLVRGCAATAAVEPSAGSREPAGAHQLPPGS